MKRVIGIYMLCALLAGCSMLGFFRVADVFPPVAPYTELRLEDDVIMELHDFAERC